PPLETPRQEKRPSTSHGGDLPSAPRTTPSPEFGRDKRPAPSAAPLPWYPPNLEGSPGEAWLFHNIDALLKHLERSGPRAIRHEKRLSMTLALGYFDGYQSNPLTYDMINYGQHAPVDPFLRAAVHEALTRPCRGLLQVCGFEVLRNDDISTI